MARLEVEMKAWVDDPESLEKKLFATCRYLGESRKQDTYFRPRSGGKRDFRLRLENGSWMVTYKRRQLQGSLEVNQEFEFTVSDPAAFRILVQDLECEVFVEKIKLCKRFKHKDFSVELNEVKGLGCFLEIERLLGQEDAELIETTRREIMALFSRYGIPEEKIENRYYMDLLLAERPESKGEEKRSGGQGGRCSE